MNRIKHLLITAPTVACLCYGGINVCDDNLNPSQNASFTTFEQREWELPIKNSKSYYNPMDIHALVEEQVNIIQEFVVTIVNNSKDLDPRVVDMVSRRYWDLI
jgi:hypothetical protein